MSWQALLTSGMASEIDLFTFASSDDNASRSQHRGVL